MKKWIAIFGLFLFLSAGVLPVRAAFAPQTVEKQEQEKDPKKDPKKNGKNVRVEAKEEKQNCGDQKGKEAINPEKKSGCCDKKAGESGEQGEKK